MCSDVMVTNKVNKLQADTEDTFELHNDLFQVPRAVSGLSWHTVTQGESCLPPALSQGGICTCWKTSSNIGEPGDHSESQQFEPEPGQWWDVAHVLGQGDTQSV